MAQQEKTTQPADGLYQNTPKDISKLKSLDRIPRGGIVVSFSGIHATFYPGDESKLQALLASVKL